MLNDEYFDGGFGKRGNRSSGKAIVIHLQRQELDAVGEVFRQAHFGDDFEVVYAAPDGDVKLMRIDNAAECNSTSLASRSLPQ